MNNSLATPWEERFGWFWYGSDVIYNWEEKDFLNAAKNFYDAGNTTAILFGTHFRFSYWAYWDDIEDTIAKITKAFHAYGIKVIEHHSTHLTYRIDNDAMKQSYLSSSFADKGFKNFLETSQANPVLGGSHMDDFGQIDGSTGKICLNSYIHTEGKDVHWVFKHYGGNAHCFNHPSFFKAYTEHLERIIKKANIDGIMNDDVQWFGAGNACTCQYCRELFYKETGYHLLDPENWSSFYENYNDPVYIAWKRFKKKSSGDFHRKLDAFYKELDFHPLRPAYCAEVLPFDTTCYGFESASELWNYIFQECCGLIKYSYVCFAIEAVHRYALASRRGVPSMALFYPATEDSTYCAWALARSWGQLYTGTMHSNTLSDKPYRAFEKKHAALYNNPLKISDLAFYFSEMTRDYTSPNAPQKYMKPFMSYMEAAYVSGLTSDMVFCRDSIEELSKHEVIIAPYIIMVGEDELEKLAQYVRLGGKLVIIGEFGTKKPDIQKRSINEAVSALGLTARLNEEVYHGKAEINYQGKSYRFNNVTSDGCVIPNGSEPILLGENGEILGVSEKIEQGEIIWLPCDIGNNDFQPAIWPQAKETDAYASVLPSLRENGGALLSLLVNQKHLTVLAGEDVIGTIYKVNGDYVVHLVNTIDMLPEEDCKVFKTDTIPQFLEGAKKLKAFPVQINMTEAKDIKAVKLYSPEFVGERSPDYTQNGKNLLINIPENLFSGYLLIHIVISNNESKN